MLTQQDALLAAVLADENRLGAAVARWISTLRGAEPDAASAQLFPFIYHRLSQTGIAPALASTLKPYYLRSWSLNTRLFAELPGVISALASVAPRPILLKAAGLIPLLEYDLGARMTGDIDVLVPDVAFGAAVAALGRAGWSAHPDEGTVLDARFTHAIQMFRGANSVDLHCHVLEESCEREADRDFWARAVPVTMNGAEARTLAPNDQMISLCVHGARNVLAAPHLRWLVDAAVIIQRFPIDWRQVTDAGVARHVAHPLADALETLRERTGAAVPDDAIARLRSAPPDELSRTLHELAGTAKLGLLSTRLQHHRARFLRGAGPVTGRAFLNAAADYLRFWCQEPRLVRVPVNVAGRVVRMAAFRLGWYRYARANPGKRAESRGSSAASQ
ncbi:MAG TPA: nucleotidyltransferase family protein [Gemmatimonadales bacterium]|jgi:hypothetical protein